MVTRRSGQLITIITGEAQLQPVVGKTLCIFSPYVSKYVVLCVVITIIQLVAMMES